MEPMKYLHNYWPLWPTAVLTLVGVLLLLYGIVRSLLHSAYTKGIWPAGIGVVLVVLCLFLCAGLNDTAFYPLQRRPAELAHHSEQLQQRVYPADHGYRFRPCAIRLWLHRLRLARHGPQKIACQAKHTCLVRNYL